MLGRLKKFYLKNTCCRIYITVREKSYLEITRDDVWQVPNDNNAAPIHEDGRPGDRTRTELCHLGALMRRCGRVGFDVNIQVNLSKNMGEMIL